jgi:hypothetical protein
MTLSGEEVAQLSRSVCEMLMALPTQDPPAAGGEPSHLAFTRISGQWNGVVAIRCPGRFAARAAAILFGKAHDQLDPIDLRDGLLEMANVVGGNIKALLPEPCRLSIPQIAEPDLAAAFPGMKLETSVDVPIDHYPFQLNILRAA